MSMPKMHLLTDPLYKYSSSVIMGITNPQNVQSISVRSSLSGGFI
jgi:hypothetical protein